MSDYREWAEVERRHIKPKFYLVHCKIHWFDDREDYETCVIAKYADVITVNADNVYGHPVKGFFRSPQEGRLTLTAQGFKLRDVTRTFSKNQLMARTILSAYRISTHEV